MEEYTVLIPETRNDGRPVSACDRATLEAYALGLFGGYTVYPSVQGAWKDPDTGTVYRDILTPLAIATDSPASVELFARAVGGLLGQLSVYVRNPSGSVSFIDTRDRVAGD